MTEEVITLQEQEIKPPSNPYTFEKLTGVALLGAAAGVLVYYIYNQLSDETKQVVKDAVVVGVKSQMRRFAGE